MMKNKIKKIRLPINAWISPSGSVSECSSRCHNEKARSLGFAGQEALEKLGWMKITDITDDITVLWNKKLTQSQINIIDEYINRKSDYPDHVNKEFLKVIDKESYILRIGDR